MSGASVVVGVILLVAGLGVGYWGYKRFRVARLISKTPTTPAGEVSGTGTVEVAGRVVPDEVMAAPISQQPETVLAAWEMEEYDDDDDSHGWETRGSGITATPFYVADDSGRVLVDPHGDVVGEGDFLTGETGILDAAGTGVESGPVLAEFEDFPEVLEDPVDEETPEHLSEFVTYQPTLRPQLSEVSTVFDGERMGGDRRFSEATLTAGDGVYVLGEAVRTDDGQTVLRPPEGDDGRFVVSDMSESALLSRTRAHTLAVGGGAILVVAGFSAIGVGLL